MTNDITDGQTTKLGLLACGDLTSGQLQRVFRCLEQFREGELLQHVNADAKLRDYVV